LNGKAALKNILGDLPFAAEVYWQFVQGQRPLTKGFSLQRLERNLPLWRLQAEAARSRQTGNYPRRRIMVFSTLRYWIEHGMLLSLALAGLGHEVTFLYLPYANWHKPLARFDQRRQSAYARKALAGAAPLVQAYSLLDIGPALPLQQALRSLPASLAEEICEVSLRDAQYTLQVEDIDQGGEDSPSARLYRLRLERNAQAAAALLDWVQSQAPEERPELLLTPNGSILEMGAVYRAARQMDIPAVTYEFGEQRGRIWLAQDSEVMLQETDGLWERRKEKPLTEGEWGQIQDLYASRQNARLWANFARLWQGVPSQGGDLAKAALGLDERPVVLLAANVIGDSLTLGRQIFSQNMTEWLERTVEIFASREDVQFVIRIHPGERYTKGPSVAQVVRQALPQAPAHIRLVEALDPVNTYDLVEIADLGLVYTTTVGMEMAMSGVPVIVSGKTHYRGKGFTLDPDSWESYSRLVESQLSARPAPRLSRAQVESAWNYAYRFFFEYPCAFPWHLLDFWKELETWPMQRALSQEGQAVFGEAFGCLAGEPRWIAA
jgi:hypothetical protein